jgi:hypothetical protein
MIQWVFLVLSLNPLTGKEPVMIARFPDRAICEQVREEFVKLAPAMAVVTECEAFDTTEEDV